MGNKNKARDLQSYRNKVAREKAKAMRSTKPVLCALCGESIDMTLPYYDKMAWTLEHVTPLAAGGHVMGRTVWAHRSCNSKKGDGRNNRQDHLKSSVPKWF